MAVSKLKSNSKAQVSLFILMGMVLIIGIFVITYVQESTLFFKPSQVMPAEVKPVITYIEKCMEQNSIEAFQIAGAQGGWVYLPPEIEKNMGAHLRFGVMKIPYWYYEGRDIMPTIKEVETDVKTYMEENIPECLNSLEAFEKEFEIKIIKEPKLETTINHEDVSIDMSYFITLRDKANRTKTKISDFGIKIPIAFKQVYDLGKEVLAKENQESYFEQITIDLMGMNDKVPFTGMEFECTGRPKEWRISDVSREIRKSLQENIYRVRVKNTDHPEFIAPIEIYKEIEKFTLGDTIKETEDGEVILTTNLPVDVPEDAYDYFHYYWDIGTDETDLKVGFNYLEQFGLIPVVRPSTRGVMTSNLAKSTSFIDLCLHVYHFTYDINYPIQVMVRDGKSLEGKGYVLQYGFPVIIAHNEPDRQNIASKVFDYISSNRDYSRECEYKEGNYKVTVTGIVNEAGDYDELNNVSIAYDCYKYYCELGNTEFLSTYYGLKTGLPTGCKRGFIEGNKEGYQTVRKQVLEENILTGIIDLEMPKLKTFNYTIIKSLYDSETYELGIEEQIGEETVITISLENELLGYKEVKVIEKDLNESTTINLMLDEAVTYDLEINLLEEERLIGGYRGEWTVSYSEMENTKELVFKAFEYYPKASDEDEEINTYLYLMNESYSEVLRPEFK